MEAIHALHQSNKPRNIAWTGGDTAARYANSLLSGVSAYTRMQLEQVIGRPRILQRGQRLFTAGGTGDSLYLINSGSFKAHVDSDSGEEQITGFHFANDLLG